MGESVAAGARTVRPSARLVGSYRPPGDKSISHRALIVGALASGRTTIRGLAPGMDVARTASCLGALGARIDRDLRTETITVCGDDADGAGPRLKPPASPLDCCNSGTTARLLAGALAGLGLPATLIGDESLSRRPMERVAVPLRAMGAQVDLAVGGTLPMEIRPGPLRGIEYENPIASAQVKSAVLLAGLGASGPTEYREPLRSRDHTERLLGRFGATLETRLPGGARGGYTVRLSPGGRLTGVDVDVPADISSALYLVIAALLVPGSDLVLEDVGLNPGRRQALDVLLRMGARIDIERERGVDDEPRGTIHVRHSKLNGTVISGRTVAWLIDEIPALAVAAAFATGETRIADAGELRAKESDRIAATVHNLRAMGVAVTEHRDGFVLQGGVEPGGAEFDSFGDHRVALAFHVAALTCRDESVIHGYDCVEISWPDFADVLAALETA